MADGQDFQAQLGTAMIRSIAYLLDEAFMVGSGVARPLGIINCGSRIDVPRAFAGAVSWSDLYSMFEKLHPSAHANAVWLASISTFPQLMAMKDASNNLIFMPATFQGISQPIPGSIFGKQIFWTDKLPTLGNRGDLVLCDLSTGYIIGMRSEVIFESSIHAGWSRDVVSFRAILRCDGQSTMANPITMRDGSKASWCVCLQ